MPLQIIPPQGVSIDVSKGEQVAQAVFEANDTAPEIAVFGAHAAQKFAERRRLDPLTEEEKQLAEVFSLAWASGLEACTGGREAEGWTCSVTVPDSVFVRVPGASVEAIRRGMAAACEVFRAGGMTSQEAAIGDQERTVYEVRGFQGPEPTAESDRGADLFWKAEKAALRAVGGDVKGGYLSVEGFSPERLAQSSVLTWKGEPEAEAIA